MRYIDRSECKNIRERGKDANITEIGALTREAARIAEQNGLGVLKARANAFRIIKASGLGAYEDILHSLEEVDGFLKDLDAHRATKY